MNREEFDRLYPQAVAAVVERRNATVSFVQRTLQIGYGVAEEMVERMESEGVISAKDSGGYRKVLRA